MTTEEFDRRRLDFTLFVFQYRRSATDGVSPSMFILAVAGNLLYGCSVCRTSM